ncbi:TetR/AcrR family transcriptional regulator [Nonomuraea longispora]|uniref:TetR/AcrR family transcriptional regulator n=1 Tax=Nonomuraea longispora TaxID=1848320 RepID=A0A4R4NLT5_9ACTN|nr:TetR/AcrR family transcriptional regulator [Nonomuraea longispora]TDC08773.1 TetR/AcrR family transcriptional regulator [Nonomuraea longispora]
MAGSNKRDAILDAAADLLAREGRDAVSTRAVCKAAGVQAPILYRLFGDKQGLLDAVASRGLAAYIAEKRRITPSGDPVEDLRRGWDLHVGFGLAEPALYALIYGSPRPGAEPEGAKQAAEILAGLVHRVALAGRLRVPEERAARVVHAAGRGTTLSLIAMPEAERDMEAARIVREAVIHSITEPAPSADPSSGPSNGHVRTGSDVVAGAITLKASLGDLEVLTPSESRLLADWLDRIIEGQATRSTNSQTPHQA